MRTNASLLNKQEQTEVVEAREGGVLASEVAHVAAPSVTISVIIATRQAIGKFNFTLSNLRFA